MTNGANRSRPVKHDTGEAAIKAAGVQTKAPNCAFAHISVARSPPPASSSNWANYSSTPQHPTGLSRHVMMWPHTKAKLRSQFEYTDVHVDDGINCTNNIPVALLVLHSSLNVLLFFFLFVFLFGRHSSKNLRFRRFRFDRDEI